MSKTSRKKREEQREKMRKRQSRDRTSSGGSGKNWYVLSEDMEEWKPKKGDHVINFIEFEAGELDPGTTKYKQDSEMDVGDLNYVLEVLVHKNVGANKDSFTCLRQYGKPCPICEHQDSLWDEDRDKAISLYPKSRCIYNVWSIYPEEEKDEGVKIWEVAAFYVEDNLDALIKKPMRKPPEGVDPNPVIADSSMEFGREISFTIGSETKTINDKSVTLPAYTAYSLDARDEDIPEEILEQAINEPDQFIVLASYEEIYAAHWGEEMESSTGVEDEDDIDDTVMEDEKEEVDKKEEVKDQDCPEDLIFGEDYDDYECCDDCNINEACKAKKEGSGGEVEEAEPFTDCPHDYVFGEDNSDEDECEDCDGFEDCAVEWRRLKEEAEKKAEKEEKKKAEKKKKVEKIVKKDKPKKIIKKKKK